MLRSPISNPMTTPMINPIRTGLSKITRAILNYNGTQWGTSANKYSIGAGDDFWAEVVVVAPSEGTQYDTAAWLSLTEDSSGGKAFHFGRRNGDIATASFWGDDLNADLAGVVDWSKVNRFTFTYDGATRNQTLELNGSVIATGVRTAEVDITDSRFLVNKFRTVESSAGYLSIKASINGELVLDLNQDTANVNYSPNLAVPDVVKFTQPAPIPSTEEDLIIDIPLGFTMLPGEVYSLKYEIDGGNRTDIWLGNSGQMLLIANEPDEMSGTLYFTVESEQTTLRYRPYNPGNIYVFSELTKLNGITYTNVMDEDWETITQKYGETDWANDYWPNLLQYSSDLTKSSWYRTRIDVEYLENETKLTTVTANDSHIRQEVSKVSGYTTYTARCRIKGPAGLPIRIIIFRDGYSEYNTSEGIVLTGEYQDISYTFEFSTEPQETVRARLDFAHLDEGGQLGDEYFVSQLYFGVGNTVDYVATTERGGRLLQYAEGAL